MMLLEPQINYIPFRSHVIVLLKRDENNVFDVRFTSLRTKLVRKHSSKKIVFRISVRSTIYCVSLFQPPLRYQSRSRGGGAAPDFLQMQRIWKYSKYNKEKTGELKKNFTKILWLHDDLGPPRNFCSRDAEFLGQTKFQTIQFSTI